MLERLMLNRTFQLYELLCTKNLERTIFPTAFPTTCIPGEFIGSKPEYSNRRHLKRYFQCKFVDNTYQYVLLIKYSIVQSRTQSNTFKPPMTFMRSLMKIPKMVFGRWTINTLEKHTFLRYSKIQSVHSAVYNTTPFPSKHDW